MIDPLFYARLARAAYHQRPYDIDVGAFRAIVADSPAGLCLAIAGTDDATTALADAEALVPHWSPELYATVPASFLRAVTGAWDAIRRIPNIRVVTGHSLGGALALITAARLRATGRAPDAVLAFAPPRVGDIGLDGIETRLYRLGEDVVPDLPPGYDQPAPMIQLGRATSLLADHDLDHIIAALRGEAAA
jgi:pimeloyl-ACP methyl ester carboxylesterase